MKKPNILFILTDDQGAWALGCSGNTDIKTPNLDKLAENGIRYENFFCASPVCSPARASIVTGEVPSCHGVLDWISAGNANTLNHPYISEHEHFCKKDVGVEYLDGHPLYVRELAESGYNCALSGKWHLGNTEKAKDGFEKWFTIYGGGCRYFHADTFENGKFKYENEYITDIITDKAIDFIDEFSKEDKPFYLSVHYTAPHSPWEETEHKKEFLDLYKNCDFTSTPFLPVHQNQILSCPVGDTLEKRRENLTGYYAAISSVDYNVGKIISTLEKTGELDNTIIIFTADNGMNMGHHGIWGKGNGTYPQNMYDTSVKIPFIINAPFIKEKGSVNTNLRSHLDIFPTLMDCAQFDYQMTDKQGGKSFYKELIGSQGENSTIAIGSEYGSVRMIRTDTKKLVIDYTNSENQFFDLENDPNEEINLINNLKYFDEINNMKKDLEYWFNKYSTEQCDARKYIVTGKGQKDLCYNEKSFENKHKYYYDK